MTTNINLSSTESSEKKPATGKLALVLSLALLLVAFSVLFALVFFKSRYNGQIMQTENEIAQEQSKLKDASYADMMNFQEGLNLLDEVIGDHAYWDRLLVNIAPYVIGEVRFESFSGKINSEGGAVVEVKGTAASLEALSRELILLKNFPGLDSLEFKETSANISQSGVQFGMDLKVNKKAFEK